jgi:hypothetical protein
MEPDSADEQESGTTQYVHILDFAKTDQSAWYDLVRKLNAEFRAEDITKTPLTFSCSVTSKLGVIHDCAWTFASSEVVVDGATAAIAVNAPTYECHIHPRTTAPKLIALLQGSAAAIHEALPGTTSIADSLPACFEQPIGATPLPASTTGPYVAASAYYTTPSYQQSWRDAQTALVAGFDRVCGDTFCSGDMSDLASLAFECAITKSTGNVKSCAWTFGGSYTLIARTGDLDLTSDTFTCPVAVHGTLAQLIDTITAPGTDDAINRPLPGTTATAYEALLGCLP